MGERFELNINYIFGSPIVQNSQNILTNNSFRGIDVNSHLINKLNNEKAILYYKLVFANKQFSLCTAN